MKRHSLKLLALLAVLAVAPASGHRVDTPRAADCPHDRAISGQAEVAALAAPLAAMPLVATGNLVAP